MGFILYPNCEDFKMGRKAIKEPVKTDSLKYELRVTAFHNDMPASVLAQTTLKFNSVNELILFCDKAGIRF